MQAKRKRKHMRILALMLAAIVAVTMAPVSVEAKSVKPKLNKTKLKIVKGKTAKLKVRNVSSKNIRKTVWTVNKSGKKVVAFTKKSNTSITLKGKKKGTAKITAKIKVGRKVYKKTAKVTVKLPVSDKKDPGDKEDEVEIEEDKKKEDIFSSTNIPDQMPNTLKPAISETELPNEILSTPGKISTAPTIVPEPETEVPEKTEAVSTIMPEPETEVPEKTEAVSTIMPELETEVPEKTEAAPTIVPESETDAPEATEQAPEPGTEDPGWTSGAIVTAKPTATVTAAPETMIPATPTPPYNLTISEEMEAAGTKNKEDYRQDVDWSEPGQVTFTNVNGYNGGLMLKLQKNGEPMDMSAYKYIEADVET